jgi:uncharacterized protein YkwD
VKSRVSLAIVFIAFVAAALATPAGAATSQRWIAPAAACPGQADLAAPPAKQVRAMRCLVNFARRGRGLPAYAASGVLNRAAAHKSADILRCGEFSHEACGRGFTYWMEQLGYPACSAGENIAWGSGRLGSGRSIFRSWMRSPGHRENILGPFEEIGIGLRVGSLEGSGAHVWTQNFGSRDC